MPYIKIWIHCVWGTKKRIPYVDKSLLGSLTDHILFNARAKGIHIDTINGSKEHLHCLLSLSQNQCISNIMQLIKGESSYWLNKNKLTRFKFEWAEEYFAVSVSESEVSKVRKYIEGQEEHHSRKTWDEEYTSFVELTSLDMGRG